MMAAEELFEEYQSRAAQGFSAVILDLDHFKSINDTYGHEAGDLVLAEVSSRLMNCLESDQIAGRLGGEEFGILLPERNELEASMHSERYRASLAASPVDFRGLEIPVTASLGCAGIGPDDIQIDDLLRRADGALYDAKNAGRNLVVAASAA